VIRPGAGASAAGPADTGSSMTGMSCGASPQWPGVISRARGRRPPAPG
jgi:hypothetical protein